jgi:MFS family permease
MSIKLGELFEQRWYRWLAYSIANTAFLVGVMLSAIGIAIPEIMRDFSIDADQMGQIISSYSYTYALMQIPGGILADKIGPRRTMSFFLLIGGSGIILFSRAPSFSLGLGGRVITAFGVGVLYVNQIKVLRGWFKPDEFATAMGVGSSINSIGGLIARPLLAILVENLYWRVAFSYIGILNLILAGVVWIVVRDQNPKLNIEVHLGKNNGSIKGLRQSFKAVFLNHQYINLFFITLFSYGGMTGVFFGWGVPFLMQGYDLKRVDAALLITITSVFSLISAPLWGQISDRFLQARIPVLRIGLFGALISTSIIAIFAPRLSILHLGLIFGLMGLTTSTLVLSYTMLNEIVPGSIAGVASAALNMGPYIGRGIYNTMAGIILGKPSSILADGTPIYSIVQYQRIFVPSLFAGFFAILITFLLKETMNKTQANFPIQ